MLSGPLIRCTGYFADHALCPSFAKVGAMSHLPNTLTMPILENSPPPTIQSNIVPYSHRGSHVRPIQSIITVIDPCSDAGKNWNHVTIETLPDNTLLEIFDFYRMDAMAHSDGYPWKWHHLAHVCRRWRCIVYASPHRLYLQILCKSGAPVECILATWATLPLVLQFQGFQGKARSNFLPDNVMIALRHPDRVCEIDLSLTSSIIGLIAELVQMPFLALKYIRMTSNDAEEPPVLGNFLGGSAPLLKRIDLHGIAIPSLAIRRLLLSTTSEGFGLSKFRIRVISPQRSLSPACPP